VSIAGKPLFPNLAANRTSPVERRNETASGYGAAGSDADTIHVNVRGAAKKDEDVMDVDSEKK
jgi:hypothetical protein